VLAVGAGLFGTYEFSMRQKDAAEEVALSLTVVKTLERIQADFQTGLSEGRGFAMTRDPEDLARSNAAFDSVASDMASVRRLTARSKEETRLLDHLEPLLAARVEALRHDMAVPIVPYPPDPETQLRRHAAQAVTAKILDDLDAIRTEERTLLERRRARRARVFSMLTWAMVAAGMIAATSGFAMIAMMMGRGRQRRHMAELSRLNIELEARVRDRTAALARSEARQRGYFANAPIGMALFLLREDGQVVHEDVNPAFTAIYGLSRDDMMRHTVRDLWPEPFARDVERRVRECVASGQLAQYIVTRDIRGENRTLDVMLVPFPDESGTASCVLGCLRDVTEKVELERQVIGHLARAAEAAELERVLLGNSPDVLSLIRVEGDVEHPTFVYEACSPAIESLIGLAPDAIVGRRPEDVLAPGLAAAVNRRLRPRRLPC
jgi:PAS domain S-box-containing protein